MDFPLSNPLKLRLSVEHEILHCLKENRECSFSLQAAGLPEAEDAFDKAVAFFLSGAEATLAPEYSKTQGAFGVIIAWGDAFFLEKKPQTLQFTLNAAHKSARIVLLGAVQADEANEPCVKHVPLAYIGRMFRHTAQQPQLFKRPGSGAGQGRI